MSRLKEILSNSKYTSYAVGIGDPDFSDLRSLISSANIENAYSHLGNHFVGRSKSNPNNLRTQKSQYKSKSNLRNVFHGFLGGIGEGGTFPFVFDIPQFNLLSNSERVEILGPKAQYVDNTKPNETTFIAIGEQFKNSTFDENFLNEHSFRIFISNIVSKDKYIQFPRLKVFDADTIVTHNQSDHKVIEIKNEAVYVYPGKYKRCLKINTCSAGIKNMDKNLSMSGEVKAIDDNSRGRCIRMASTFLQSFGKFSGSGFTNLVRNHGYGLGDGGYLKLAEYMEDSVGKLGLDNVDHTFFKKFTEDPDDYTWNNKTPD